MYNIEKGFTIVELMIAITILAIVTSLAIPSLLWITQHSLNSTYLETKNYIAYIRNKAILSNHYMCVTKVTNDATKGTYLKQAYLKQTNTDNPSARDEQILHLKNNINIISNIPASDNALVCFYPNGFIVNGETITPNSNSLNTVMNTGTTTYYQAFDYSNLDQVKLTISSNNSQEPKTLCISKGGEFKKCS